MPIVLAALAALAWPADALATDRFVDNTGGSNTGDCTGSPCLNIAYALGVSNPNDTIHIAPGIYIESVDTNKHIDFEGAGRPAPGGFFDPNVHTFVSAGLNAVPGFRLREGGAIRHLLVNGRGTASFADTSPAIELLSNVGPPFQEVTIADVTANGGADNSNGARPALNLPLLTNDLKLVAEDSTFNVPGVAHVVDVAERDVDLTMRRVRITSDGPALNGLLIEDGAEALLDQLDIDSTGLTAGVTVDNWSRVTVERSRIVVGRAAAVALGTNTIGALAGTLTVRDSLLVATGSDAFALIASTTGTASQQTELRGSTLVSGFRPLTLASYDSSLSKLNAVNSVFRHPTQQNADIYVSQNDVSAAQLAASSSSWTSVEKLGGAAVTDAGSGTNIAGDPQLAGDYSLLATSALIDRGDPSVATAGELDLVGSPRALDGNFDCLLEPDIGAFERTGGTGCPPPGPGVASDTLPLRLSLSVRSVRLNSRGEALVPVTCSPQETEPCTGTLSLSAKLPAGIAQRRRRARTIRLGSKRFSVQPGKTVRVKVKLSRRNVARLRKAKKLRVAAALRATDRAGNVATKNATFTLRPAKVRKRRRR